MKGSKAVHASGPSQVPNTLEQKQVSFFKSANSKLPEKTLTLRDVFRMIESGDLPIQKKIRALNDQWLAAKQEHGEKSPEAKAIYRKKQLLKEKSWLAAFSLSALFNGKRANENVAQHTGLLQIDIDHLESPQEWNKTLKALQSSPYIWRLWRSISGDGIKGAMLIPPDVKRHRDSFAAAAAHVKELTGRDIDPACKDPARICFLSSSKVWTNDKAFPLEPSALPVKPGNGSTVPASTTDSTRLEGQVRAIAESILGPLGEWQKDERDRTFAYCRCPDTTREHHFEKEPNTRVYINPGSMPRIECRHGECAPMVKARNDLLRRLFFERDSMISLPDVEDMSDLLSKPIVLPTDVIEGLLSKGGKMLLGGGSKSFKTWMLIDIMSSVVSGTDWLNFKTTKGRGLYINLELQRGFFSYRNKLVMERKELDVGPGTYEVWNLRGHATDLRHMLPSILDRGGQNKYDVIVFDPIYKILGEREENVTHHITAIMNMLEKVAVESGAAVIFGAHFSKGNQSLKESIDRVSGSGTFARDPDTILIFTKHEKPNAFVVEATLRNHPPIEPFCVLFDFPLMRLANDLSPLDLKQAATGAGKQRPSAGNIDKTLACLDAEPLTFADWCKAACDACVISHKTFEKYQRILADDGRVKKTDDNKWTTVGDSSAF